MPALYITSNAPLAGKTAFCMGLAAKLRAMGKSVGYMKPVSIAASEAEAVAPDGDIAFAGQTLNLTEAAEQMVVLRGTEEQARAALAGEEFGQRVKQAYVAVAADKTVVLVEGLGGFGGLAEQTGRAVVDALDARVVVVLRYVRGQEKDDVLRAQLVYGRRLLGVIFNKVPARIVDLLTDEVPPYAERAGVRVLGFIKEDRALATISVGELVKNLGGRYLNDARAEDLLVERMLIGGASIHAGGQYFGRFPEKVAIVSVDKADIQLAALEGTLQCLVLTGDREPLGHVRFKAEEKGVPLVLVNERTKDVAAKLEGAFAEVRFRQPRKIERMASLLEQVDLSGLLGGL